jgi:hypothetical protein
LIYPGSSGIFDERLKNLNLGKNTQLLSPIDVDIKKPLVMETLKLVAPKKKLEIM